MVEKAKNHWDIVYETKSPDQVSWTQVIPKTSLDFIHSLNLPKSAKIIDIGGGDSRLVDFLLQEGFENITVLDISAKAIEKAKNHLGEQARQIHWVVSDITEFEPSEVYDLWHDRATFHFLTSEDEIEKYVRICENNISDGGYLVLGTFSEKGPKKCSGLDISQYSESTLSARFKYGFKKIKCVEENHITPQNAIQHFLFCSFNKRKNI